MARPLLRRMGRDAVTEVVGFILMFGISAIILVVSLQGFTIAQDRADEIVAGVQMNNLANRVASRVVDAAEVSQAYPNATYEVSVALPAQIGVYDYYVNVTKRTVYVNASNDQLVANATTFNTNALADLRVSGQVHSSALSLKLRYTLDDSDPANPVQRITINGG